MEIGSEFWNIPMKNIPNGYFPKHIQWFLSGRSALMYILEDITKKFSVHTVALPSWCCDSMIIPFLNAGLKVYFYPVYFEGGKLVQELNIVCDVILVLDYFGYGTSRNYSAYPGIVIRDVTHSVFSKSYWDADYYFGSLRKWCGFLTGGFAWGDQLCQKYMSKPDLGYVYLRKKAMHQKKKYIAGKSKSKVHLITYKKAEEKLDSIHIITGAAYTDIENASRLDIEYIKKKRRENATVLLKSLEQVAIFPELKETDCPLFVPIYLKNRDKLKRYLIQNNIYCPIHWPISKYHHLEKRCYELYNNELSLVCDQRYTVRDMERICELIKLGE